MTTSSIASRTSICIATCRRPDRLAALLEDLTLQTVTPREVVIVDNDASGSAHAVVEARQATGAPFSIVYAIEPRKNIAHARNKTIELARGDWVAFLDDDERAPADWLARLSDAATRFDASGVLGPVVPRLPPNAPGWIRRGHFYDWPRTHTGTQVAPNRLRFGNVLLRTELLRSGAPPFDPEYGLTGGEDGDLLARLAQQGARIVWCDEAQVREPIEPARLNLRWLLRRSLRGGQDFARHTLAGRYGPVDALRRAAFIARAVAQLGLAAAFALICLPLGRHYAAHWLTRASANFGKLSVLWGWHYREYA
jgi:succinoglycan biosynthesis protein ExoM